MSLKKYSVLILFSGSVIWACAKNSSANGNHFTLPFLCAVSVDSINNVSCNGLSDGGAVVSVTGFMNESYYWINSSGDTVGNSNAVVNLSADLYTLFVSDSFCTETITVTIAEPDPLQSAAAAIPASCYTANDGSIDLTTSGGTLPYDFLWSNGSVSEDLSGLTAGEYTVFVSDSNNCADTLAVNVSEPAPSFTVGSLTVGVSCNGYSDGFINLTIVGNSGYSFLWSNSAVTEDISALPAGVYSVTVSDVSGGCMQTHSYTVNEPPALQLSFVVTSEINGNDGAIDLTVSGGMPPYTFDWSYDGVGDNDDAEDLSLLPGGVYTVVVNDQNACADTLEAEVVSTLGISVAEGSEPEVFPNPLSDLLYFNVRFPVEKIVVKEISGLTVKVFNNGWESGLDLSFLPGGIYFLEVKTQEGFFTKKIIKASN